MSLLAVSEGVSIILVMLVVGGIFLGVILLGEFLHRVNHRRHERRAARRAVY